MEYPRDIISDLQEETALTLFEQYVAEANGRNPVIEPNPRLSDITRAIKQRKYVGFYYNEEGDDDNEIVKPGFRLIEPYVFGYGYSHGGEIHHATRGYLRGYLIMSSQKDRNSNLHKIKRKSISKSNRKPLWRMFRIDRIHTWQMFNWKVPKPRNGYNPNDRMIADIIVSAKF